MPTALYYPHTTIKDKRLLRNALLLWDRIECITPGTGKRDHHFGETVWDEATSLIVENRVPTDEERGEVHRAIQSLITAGLPNWQWLQAEIPGLRGRYPVYPSKLADDTWRLLKDHSLTEWRADGDAEVSAPLGLLVMSLLADACAGSQKRKVTDRTSAYSTLSKFLAISAGVKATASVALGDDAEQYDRVVNVTIRVINTDEIPIENLVALRKREQREAGTDYRSFRTRYLERVESLKNRLLLNARTKSDVKEIEREFGEEMRDDLHALRSELGLARRKALLSKEVVIGAAVLASAPFVPIPGFVELVSRLSPVGIAALASTYGDYTTSRRKALRSHAMSWLYLASPSRVRVVMKTA